MATLQTGLIHTAKKLCSAHICCFLKHKSQSCPRVSTLVVLAYRVIRPQSPEIELFIEQ